MGRPVSMADDDPYSYSGTGTTWAQNGTYDYAGRMTGIQIFNAGSTAAYPAYSTQSMGYNANGQLTSMNWSGMSGHGLAYAYSSTQNNGQITQVTDTLSGETVSYTYDALKRLTEASSSPTSGSSPPAWVQQFSYDGFGNMTSKTLNGGANMVPAVDPTTNRLTSGYDANGNMLTGYGLTMTYDERNRLASASPTSGGTEYYGYAPNNKRIYRWNPSTGTEEWTFYGAKGERIGAFALNTSGTYYFSATQTNRWFAGQLISNANGFVFRDRVGTDRETGARYYPYGDEITSTANGTEKYGTYFRDSFTMLDYADQRYYASEYGRFNTADPMMGSAGSQEPGSWNRYAYVGGDPVNRSDPRGLCVEDGQYNFWDNQADVPPGAGGILEDFGPGLCTQNTTWVNQVGWGSWITLNGMGFQVGSGSSSGSGSTSTSPGSTTAVPS
jgi:RHS repeat-associated protein